MSLRPKSDQQASLIKEKRNPSTKIETAELQNAAEPSSSALRGDKAIKLAPQNSQPQAVYIRRSELNQKARHAEDLHQIEIFRIKTDIDKSGADNEKKRQQTSLMVQREEEEITRKRWVRYMTMIAFCLASCVYCIALILRPDLIPVLLGSGTVVGGLVVQVIRKSS
ncbi:MAG: hypothetical protein ACSHX7_11305 [Luteolibacter sp.]